MHNIESEETSNTAAHDDDPLSDSREQAVLYSALDSFRQYRQAAHYNITHLRRQAFYCLPSVHTDLLCEPPFLLPDSFLKVDDAIDSNADIAEAILKVSLPAYGLDLGSDVWKGKTTASDLDKARSTIRQLYRDWSAEGQVERDACFGPIMTALKEYLTSKDPSHSRVLVPGAGLGRLLFDICLAGYSVEGNEISHHQLLASNYMLNYIQRVKQHTLYPWALSFSNHHKRSDQFAAVRIPDVHTRFALELEAIRNPTEVDYNERMSMSGGDFCVIYCQEDNKAKFDAVTTCFFIDTAPNLINYIEAVRHCLKSGGVWINLGPLLWHFEEAPTPAEKEKSTGSSMQDSVLTDGIGDPGSFELSNDEVIVLLTKYGFHIEKHEETSSPATGYIQDPRSMLQNIYHPVFWVARKL